MIGAHSKQEREEFDRLAASMSDEKIYNHAFNGWLSAKRASVGNSNSVELHQIAPPQLGFVIEPPGDGTRVLRWNDGTCRPAEETEIAMWDALQRASVGSAEPVLCHQCGLPQSDNPHPEAGKLARVLEVNTQSVCIPCLTLSRHQWARRAQFAESALAEIRKGSAPPSADANDALRWRAGKEHGYPEYGTGEKSTWVWYISRWHELGEFETAEAAIDAAIAAKEPT